MLNKLIIVIYYGDLAIYLLMNYGLYGDLYGD